MDIIGFGAITTMFDALSREQKCRNERRVYEMHKKQRVKLRRERTCTRNAFCQKTDGPATRSNRLGVILPPPPPVFGATTTASPPRTNGSGTTPWPSPPSRAVRLRRRTRARRRTPFVAATAAATPFSQPPHRSLLPHREQCVYILFFFYITPLPLIFYSSIKRFFGRIHRASSPPCI